MRLSSSLSRLIMWSMVASTVGGALIAGIGSYMLYGLVWQVAPHLMAEDDWWFPSGIDWIEIGLLAAVGGCLAFVTAVRVGRQIVSPLTSVAESMRRIAEGDLSARASIGRRSTAEAKQLVDDLNHMAANLEKSSKSILRWNALIAHELRTPVTILQGRLQGLADGIFEPDPQLYRSLVTQVEGLARLVEDLRTITLSDAGHLDLVVREVDLAHELEVVIRLVEPALRDAGFSLLLDLQPGRAWADPTRLRQALLALLHNALCHAAPGELRVALTWVGHVAEIMVADRGPGLDPIFDRRAFLPFERHVSPDRATRGSGLGLAVVRAVAQAHGGSAVYEKLHGGACFRIRFNGARVARPESSSQVHQTSTDLQGSANASVREGSQAHNL